MWATVQTLGADVIDTFYVLGPDGVKVTDPAYLAEIEVAVLSAIGADTYAMNDRPPPNANAPLGRSARRPPRPVSVSPTTSTSASGSRRFSPSRPTSAAMWSAGSIHSGRCRNRPAGAGVPGYVTPKITVGAVVGNDDGELPDGAALTVASGSPDRLG